MFHLSAWMWPGAAFCPWRMRGGRERELLSYSVLLKLHRAVTLHFCSQTPASPRRADLQRVQPVQRWRARGGWAGRLCGLPGSWALSAVQLSEVTLGKNVERSEWVNSSDTLILEMNKYFVMNNVSMIFISFWLQIVHKQVRVYQTFTFENTKLLWIIHEVQLVPVLLGLNI